jgi:dTDP-4-dehydrorhamnose reductase
MSPVLVTGGNGQLGRELQRSVPEGDVFDFLFHDIDSLNICDRDSLEVFVKKFHPEYIINCAAYTAVDKAEDEQELAFRINEQGVANLVDTAKAYNIQLIHISTDFVFDGLSDRPYHEDDQPGPLSVYGKSKLAGERKMTDNETGIIIRTSWLYSPFGNNFVRTMLRLGAQRDEVRVVNDQIGTPTRAKDLAAAIIRIVQSHHLEKEGMISGIFHYSNEGQCSWYEFADAIMKAAGLSCRVVPIPSSQYPQQAQRPGYSALDKTKIKDRFSLDIPHWRSALNESMEEIIKYL